MYPYTDPTLETVFNRVFVVFEKLEIFVSRIGDARKLAYLIFLRVNIRVAAITRTRVCINTLADIFP